MANRASSPIFSDSSSGTSKKTIDSNASGRRLSSPDKTRQFCKRYLAMKENECLPHEVPFKSCRETRSYPRSKWIRAQIDNPPKNSVNNKQDNAFNANRLDHAKVRSDAIMKYKKAGKRYEHIFKELLERLQLGRKLLERRDSCLKKKDFSALKRKRYEELYYYTTTLLPNLGKNIKTTCQIPFGYEEYNIFDEVNKGRGKEEERNWTWSQKKLKDNEPKERRMLIPYSPVCVRHLPTSTPYGYLEATKVHGPYLKLARNHKETFAKGGRPPTPDQPPVHVPQCPRCEDSKTNMNANRNIDLASVETASIKSYPNRDLEYENDKSMVSGQFFRIPKRFPSIQKELKNKRVRSPISGKARHVCDNMILHASKFHQLSRNNTEKIYV